MNKTFAQLGPQFPYLLKFVDVDVNVEDMNGVRLKLLIRKMVFTKLLLDVDIGYEFLCVRFIRTHAQ